MRRIVLGFVLALTTEVLAGQTASHVSQYVPQGVVSDWASGHVRYPESKDESVTARNRNDPRWLQNWYLRHQEVWWPEHRRRHHRRRHRDWSVSLSATPSTAAFEPTFDFSYVANLDTGFGSFNTTDNGNGQYLATSGFLTITATGTGVPNGGSYPLFPGGPAQTLSPSGKFRFDNLLYPGVAPLIDNNGPLFIGGGFEINVWSHFPGPDNYEFDDYNGSGYTNDATSLPGVPFILTAAPGGGQTSPAKFVFDVNAAPSCTNDYVVIGIPATPAAGGQANLVGVNNLYSGGVGALCPTGPTVIFSYASGTGQVPASVVLSQNGSQIAYVENLPTGSSYFHVLTIGTTGTNGTSATAAVVPGVSGGNNAVDTTVLLSPDGGTTNQSSTNTVFVVYTHNDASDVAYATTYSPRTGSGYLYKISNVFKGSATPTIAWSVSINAVPSSPVYDIVSNKVFFTDSNGSIDYVIDTGTSPSVVYGSVVANGATSQNPVIVDSTNQMVYASFNTNGANALVVQAPTSMASTVSVAVGTGSTVYTGPYEPNFNLAWYEGSGTPVMYVAGAGATGTTPTLYSVGFSGGVMNATADATTAALATGTADSSPITTFYNSFSQKDYLFVGVTDHCVATVGGGTAGCVMSFDITSGFPTVNANSIALAAAGGTTGIIVDNASGSTGASSIYYATKTGATLVKATQSALQ
jgi:hypothetical protein